jgi:hypothetical protein
VFDFQTHPVYGVLAMSAVITKLKGLGSSTLPEAELESSIRQWWDEKVQKDLDDPFANKKETSGTLYDVLVEMDSLSVVGILADLGNIVGFDVRPSLIKRGGYRDCDEMVTHLIKGIRESRRGKKLISTKDKKNAA